MLGAIDEYFDKLDENKQKKDYDGSYSYERIECANMCEVL